MVVRLAGRELAGPGGEEGHADAAFKRLTLVAAERGVYAGVVGEVGFTPGTAVVADEEDEGVLVGAGFAEVVRDTPDGVIEA